MSKKIKPRHDSIQKVQDRQHDRVTRGARALLRPVGDEELAECIRAVEAGIRTWDDLKDWERAVVAIQAGFLATLDERGVLAAEHSEALFDMVD